MLKDDVVSSDLLENLYDGVYFLGRDRIIRYWNKAAEAITGFTKQDAIGQHCPDHFLMHVDQNGSLMCGHACPVLSVISDGNPREVDVFLRHKDGHRVPVAVRAAPIRDANGQITGVVEIFNDNSTRVAISSRMVELERLALLDTLTQLANRRFMETRLNSAIEELKRNNHPFGVLMIDLDHLKSINDSYGHEAGDEALKLVSRTLGGNTRPFDLLARWGGDEFLACVRNITGDELVSVAERFRSLTEHSSLKLGNESARITLSTGVAMARIDDTVQILLQRADKALYEAKQRGRNCLSVAE